MKIAFISENYRDSIVKIKTNDIYRFGIILYPDNIDKTDLLNSGKLLYIAKKDTSTICDCLKDSLISEKNYGYLNILSAW